MIYVGIDVAKDKHDRFITNSDGEVLFKSFTISNNRDGFETLCKADIRNPLRYLLMNAVASRSVSGSFQLPLT